MPPPELISGAGRRAKFLAQARAAAGAQSSQHRDALRRRRAGRPLLSRVRVRRRPVAARRDGRPLGEPAARDRARRADQPTRSPRGTRAASSTAICVPTTSSSRRRAAPKILNFGLTRVDDERAGARRGRVAPTGSATDPHGVAGYLSPEQALGGDDRRAQRRLLVRRAAPRDADRPQSVRRPRRRRRR